MKIRSTYMEGQNFTMTVVGEEEDYYLVKLDFEYRGQFEEGDKITKLRKCLIGSLYEIEETYQLSMF